MQGQRRLSATEHADAGARVAYELRQRGVKSGDRVLLQGFNHVEWLVTFWALHCIGATAALGNAWWSAQEMADAIEVVQPALIVVDRVPERALPAGFALVRFADIREVVDRRDTAALHIDAVDEEALAVVIFSSGTTGKAKGVVLSHRSVIANIHNLMRMTGRLPSELDASHAGTVSLVTMPLFHQGACRSRS